MAWPGAGGGFIGRRWLVPVPAVGVAVSSACILQCDCVMVWPGGGGGVGSSPRQVARQEKRELLRQEEEEMLVLIHILATVLSDDQ